MPPTVSEVVNAFSSVKNSAWCNADDLRIRSIKHALDTADVLEYVFNLTFPTGIFPHKLQVAKILALHKGGDKNTLNNYRPVSILPVIYILPGM